MNRVAKTERTTRSVLIDMADRFGMEAAAFEATVRTTCFPSSRNEQGPTREEFAAFLLVAKEYGLNPLTKEIYAFRGKSGGIQPIVSIDGWMNLINTHPAMDGLEFDDHIDRDTLTAVTARIWRKDRRKPIAVTEYMVECQRGTEPWKQWPRRMLRHKAAIQCARYAFGFSGIVDPDEFERQHDMTDVTPRPRLIPPPSGEQRTLAPPPQEPMEVDASPPEPANTPQKRQGVPPARKTQSGGPDTDEPEKAPGGASEAVPDGKEPEPFNSDAMTTVVMKAMHAAKDDAADLDRIWEGEALPRQKAFDPFDWLDLEKAYRDLKKEHADG